MLEIRVLPDTEALEPAVMRQLGPRMPLYVSYARAAIQMGLKNADAAAQSFAPSGLPGRGEGRTSIKVIADQYNALVAEGERHPVKALAEIHHVTISAASRWIKEARERDLIDDTKEGK